MSISKTFGTALVSATLLVSGSAIAGQQEAAKPAPVQTVSLHTVVSDGQQPLKEPVTYRVYRLEPQYLRGQVGEYNGATAVVELSAGRYRVVTDYRDTTDYEDFNVSSETTKHVVNLNAGSVVMTAIKAPGKPPLTKGVRWEIVTYGKDAEGKRHLVTRSDDPQAEFILPAGYYLANAYVDGREIRHTIEVSEGAIVTYSVVLN